MAKKTDNQDGKVDFTGLILGFSSAALHYLGIVPQDQGKPSEKNLVLARQNIEILSLLKEKTKGNLTQEESRLTEEVLADLQLKFVEAAKT